MPNRIKNRPIVALVRQRCALLGFSERTVGSYGNRLAAFEDWCGVPALESTVEQAAAWQADCAARGVGQRTLHHNRCALAFLWRHLRASELDGDVVPQIGCPPSPPAEIADPEELARLFAATPDPLQRLFCQFIYATGLRSQEAAAVRIRDLDLIGRSVAVVSGKSCRRRRSILPDGIIALLRPHIRFLRPDALLFTVNGRPINLDVVNWALRQARARIGMHRPLTIHRLRHSFATHLHERGAGLVELQRLLGHQSPMITIIYLGLREKRRAQLAEIGDLIAALPPPAQEQQRIAFGGGLV